VRIGKLHFAVTLLVCGASSARAEVEDLEFVAEHLGEVAMDNRYAALPIWPSQSTAAWRRTVQAGYSETRTGELELAGPDAVVRVTP
jgi:hypothetical protein